MRTKNLVSGDETIDSSQNFIHKSLDAEGDTVVNDISYKLFARGNFDYTQNDIKMITDFCSHPW